MNILVAVDGSKYSEKAVEFASKLASKTGSSLNIIHVIPQISSTKGGIIRIMKEEIGSPDEAGKKYLRKARRIARGQGVKPKIKLREGDPSEEILKETEEREYHMIVVASCGKGKVNKLLLGSVCSDILHNAKCPVLVVR